MSENLSQALQKLIQTVRLRHPLGQEAPPSVWVTNASGKGKSIYVNRNEKPIPSPKRGRASAIE